MNHIVTPVIPWKLGTQSQAENDEIQKELDLQQQHGSPEANIDPYVDFRFEPNDKREQDRMDLLHFIYRCVLSRRLYCAPIAPNPRRVLDLGTGTGNWAIEFADQHQKSQVLGTDLSPIQRISIPPNCTFEIDDFEAEWPYIVAATDDTHAPKPSSPRADNRTDELHNNDNLTTSVPTPATSPILFDFIHTREITGSVHDYSKLFERAYRHVAPGGYLEMQSMEANFFSDDGTHERAVTAMQWQRLLVEASRRFGKELGVEGGWKEGMEQAGFVDVEEVVFKVPLSPWPKDARMKDLGRYQATHVQEMLQSYSLALFTRVLEWSKEELDVLLRAVGNDLKDMRSHLYTKVRVVYGRKRE
ncbi:TAM domain methyltransferase [Histoplasma capsulatum var. duboisii H88]|uniref:TAM domain methyltransferase n=2 Tax=Ajellomyces capsulatus TaxID=5037 RepID=F0UMB0_AJEC8|nr:TAM domain methyltransferase [Histoplasma capsulatum H143]EGC48102.1 TAM domain methyltransferase [Histoplasma capsulatum var. duboisii H88]